jgi:hypothetical protein
MNIFVVKTVINRNLCERKVPLSHSHSIIQLFNKSIAFKNMLTVPKQPNKYPILRANSEFQASDSNCGSAETGPQTYLPKAE